MSYPILTFARLVWRDALGGLPPLRPASEHLQAAVDWLQLAHDRSPDGGVSYGFSLRGGWRPSYRETSGYIATTFFDLASRFGQERFRDRAVTIADWLREVQNADGSFSNPSYAADRGIVFDTGQDLFGLVRAHRETGEERFLAAAVRAADWLVEIADDSGRWTRNTHLGVPHVYNTRVAWALLELDAIAPEARRVEVARANLDWAVSQCRDGWFENCAFEPGVAPFTHTIAYAIRGLLESGRLLGAPEYFDVAHRAAAKCLEHVRDDGFIPGQIDTGGRPRASYSCLTGNCQLAIIWAKIFAQSEESRFREAAASVLSYVARTQVLDAGWPDVRGAIRGSHPIWGRYSRLTFPNWATKFFVDGMLLCERWLDASARPPSRSVATA